MKTLAHYRIGPKLGEGGMGEVYRATDTKLDREVALKLLPSELTEDPARLERFRREARSLAALSHPNIGAIHGIEENEGRVALVLELIEGDTLSDRLAEGPMALEEALPIAEQIAAAVECAHEQGIIHRDLKPANIKLTPSGQVKVLDFGLAKSIRPAAETREVSESPTVMMTAAQPGMIMGTAPYMSPEQAKGLEVDRRADIWAYGALLFEMVAGERLFDGDDVTEVLAAVISHEPDLSRLPADTPPWLRDLIERCLRRALTMRLPHMAAARIALVEGPSSEEPRSVPATGASARWAWVVAALLVGVALGGAVFGGLGDSPPASGAESTTYSELVFDPPPLPASYPDFSPDGRTLVYVGGDETRPRMIYVRSLDDGTTTPLPGSQYADKPIFSPDGERVAFTSSGRLLVARLGGGFPQSIAAVAGGAEGMVWLPDDTLVFASLGSRFLQRIPASGGDPEALEFAAMGESMWMSDPMPLPDPDRLLVSVQDPVIGGGSNVALVSLSERSMHILTPGSSPAWVAPSTLTFLQRGALVAAPFDPEAGEITGPERAVSPRGAHVVTLDQSTGHDLLAGIEQTGTALFPMNLPDAREVVWVDREGNQSPTGFGFQGGDRQAFAANGAVGVSLSPEGDRIVVLTEQAPVVVSLDDVDQRRTLPQPGTSNAYARWMPDGEHIYLLSNASGVFQGYTIAVTGGSAPTPLTREAQSVPTSFFSDGSAAIGYVISPDTARDLWYFDLRGNDSEPILQTPANERAPVLSPDDRAFAYVSDELGEDRVFLRMFPDVGQAWPISEAGGSAPVWSPDGREIYYLENSIMMARPVDYRDGVTTGPPQRLFPVAAYEQDPFGNRLYDVAADGRFIMVRLGLGSPTWRWIQNWTADLHEAIQAR